MAETGPDLDDEACDVFDHAEMVQALFESDDASPNTINKRWENLLARLSMDSVLKQLVFRSRSRIKKNKGNTNTRIDFNLDENDLDFLTISASKLKAVTGS